MKGSESMPGGAGVWPDSWFQIFLLISELGVRNLVLMLGHHGECPP